MELRLEWREAESQSWLLVGEDGKRVHGQVYAHDDQWVWIATVPRRVRLSPADGVTYSGLATTASGAKRIVETVLEETGALAAKPRPPAGIQTTRFTQIPRIPSTTTCAYKSSPTSDSCVRDWAGRATSLPSSTPARGPTGRNCRCGTLTGTSSGKARSTASKSGEFEMQYTLGEQTEMLEYY
jgi:hypothetical protein